MNIEKKIFFIAHILNDAEINLLSSLLNFFLSFFQLKRNEGNIKYMTSIIPLPRFFKIYFSLCKKMNIYCTVYNT